LELPIDKITPTEERSYEGFRQDYLARTHRYYEPIGLRLGLGEKTVRWDVMIVPTSPHSGYTELRALTGSGTMKFDPGNRTPNTLLQGVSRVGAEMPWRRDKIVGDQALARLESGPAIRRFAEAWVNDSCGATSLDLWFLAVGALADGSLPVLGGFKLSDTKEPAKIVEYFLPAATTEPAEEDYRGTSMFRSRIRQLLLVARSHHARVDDSWYISFSEALVKSQIELGKDRKEKPKDDALVEATASVFLAPGALVKMKDSLGLFLEWETHHRALDNNAIWYVLYRNGLLAADATETQKRTAALHWFGFVPVSPDKASYKYDRRSDDVMNERHGSPARPKLKHDLDEASLLAKILGGIESLRADLLFQEEGVRTTVIVERKVGGK
jgi:hypothetical protein